MGLVPSDTSYFERKACNIFKSPFVSEVIELFSKTEEKIKSVNQLRLSRRRVKHKQEKKKKVFTRCCGAGQPEGGGVNKHRNRKAANGEATLTC